MTQVYVDESIHTRGDFVVTAAVCSPESLDDPVFAALAEHGFRPGRDEFKSSMAMKENPAAQSLRGHLRHILWRDCKLAIAVCPVSERENLGALTFGLLEKLNANPPITGGAIYFDKGIRLPKVTSPNWAVHNGCDSRLVGGIQLADCAAHIASVQLLSEMGFISKMVPTSDMYPEPEVEMAWQLWTSLRYSLASGTPIDGFDDEGMCEPMMLPFGLLVTDSCSAAVKDAVEKRLSTVWLGCIH